MWSSDDDDGGGGKGGSGGCGAGLMSSSPGFDVEASVAMEEGSYRGVGSIGDMGRGEGGDTGTRRGGGRGGARGRDGFIPRILTQDHRRRR